LPDFGMVTAASLYQSMVGCVLVVAVNLGVRRISPQDALF
jgi:putative aldouronate transport system permease protein